MRKGVSMYQLGLIGYPIKHSLSPWIHEQFLKKANLSGRYTLFEIGPNESFAQVMEELKRKELDGFNVTVPYKQTIIPYLDEIDTEAESIGAVNTVLNDNGRWIGYNTDGKGYLRALENKFPKLLADKTNKILILGAGGAARGIYYALTASDFEYVDIANRTIESASHIAKLKMGKTKTEILSLIEAENKVKEYDIFIQTSSVGMNPNHEDTIISVNDIKKTSIVSDIVYQPIDTAILRQARSVGAAVHFGHTMLIYQAQYAFEIWTGKRVSIGSMDKELQLILEGR